jgi:hypothetical protein
LEGPLDFPEVTTIGKFAFDNCTGLTDVHLPKAYSFGDQVFTYIKSGCILRIDSPEDPDKIITFGSDCFNNSATMTLYLGAGAKGAGDEPRPTSLPASGATWNGYTWGTIGAYETMPPIPNP